MQETINYNPEELNENTEAINNILELIESLGYETRLEKFNVDPDFRGDKTDPYFAESIAFQVTAIEELKRVRALIEEDLKEGGELEGYGRPGNLE